MNHVEIDTLEAFIIALSQLKEIPHTLAEKLATLDSTSPAYIGKLHRIANEEFTLHDLYWSASEVINEDEAERTKGPIGSINYEIEENSQELKNFIEKLPSSSDPISLSKQTIQEIKNLRQILEQIRKRRNDSK